MISGRKVTVVKKTQDGHDRFNDPVYKTAETDVDDVVIQRGDTQGLTATRPDGSRVDFTLHFPKTYTGDLRGAEIVLYGEFAGRYEVVGEPYPYQLENTPTRWWMPVEVVAVHG